MFVFKWRPEIFNDMLATLLANTPITDIFPGSGSSTMLQVAAIEDARQYAMMVKILEAFNLDSIEGPDLDAKGFEYNLTRFPATGSTGYVTISDSTITKVSSQIYPGTSGPIAGATGVNVVSASGFGASGSVIIGRGTNNVETISFLSVTDNTSYFTLNLSTGLANDHGTEESVILSQGGNRVIAAGTVGTVPQSDNSNEIEFTVNSEQTLLDGEDSLMGVLATCSITGSITRIPAGAIQGFTSAPFNGARITNPLPFTNGDDVESDQAFRDRIRNHGVANSSETGISTGIIGIIDTDDNKRVVSSKYVKGIDTYDTLYIDDGTGFEPSFEGQGIETVIQEAAGSEKTIQLQNYPVMKASLTTDTEQPFNIFVGDTLIIDNDGTSETITFVAGDILNDGFASAIEITKRINASSNLVEARTAEGGTKVIITSIQDRNERLQVLGGTANAGLLFPEDSISETLKLYKNDIYLYKDGRNARIETDNFISDMNFTGGPFTFDVIIDGKSSNTITVTINSSDFTNPSTPTAQEVIDAINDDLVGAEASAILDNTVIRLECTGVIGSGSKIEVVSGGSGLGSSKLDFEVDVEYLGIDADYTLNRFDGQIRLATPLTILDRVDAGSRATRAFFDCVSPGPYSITSGETLIVDNEVGSDTYTFGSSGAFTPQEIIDQIYANRLTSNSMNSIGFSVVNKGGQDYLRIYNRGYNSDTLLMIDGLSTATGLDFPTDIEATGTLSNVAFSQTQDGDGYTLGPAQTLIVEMDGDPINRTFVVPIQVSGTVSASTSPTVFSASGLAAIFDENSFFTDFKIRFNDNTTTVLLRSASTTVLTYNGTTGALVCSAGLLATPAIGDTFVLLPVTARNLKELLSKPEHTPLSVYGDIEVVTNDDEVQISSKKDGSAGQVQVIGGTANSFAIPFLADGTISGTFQTSSTSGLSINLPATIDDDNSSPVDVVITNISGISSPFTITVDAGATNLTGYTVGQNATITDRSGLHFSAGISEGVDGYKNFTGLLRKVQRTVDGWDQDIINYPGIKTSGSRIEVNSPVISPQTISADVTTINGVNIISIRDEIKSTIASYINGLKVGQDVVLSEIIARVKKISGVYDVRIISPVANIPVADNAVARISIESITVS